MATVRDLQDAQRSRRGRGRRRQRGGGDGEPAGDGHEQITEDEEKLRLEREERERQEAIEHLKRGPGGTPASAFALQITGPEVELPAHLYERFEKDREVAVDVAGVVLRAWVKTVKDTTVKKGGHAVKTVVVAIEESEETAQMRLGEEA